MQIQSIVFSKVGYFLNVLVKYFVNEALQSNINFASWVSLILCRSGGRMWNHSPLLFDESVFLLTSMQVNVVFSPTFKHF